MNKWISKFLQLIIVFTVLLCVVYFVYPGPGYVADTVLSIAIVIILFLIHEGLHFYQAKKLGYNVKWYRGKITMGFDIEDDVKDKEKWKQDLKKIGYFPYIFIMPASVIILTIGFLLNSLGIAIAGFACILLHCITFPLEGRDEEEKEAKKKAKRRIKRKDK